MLDPSLHHRGEHAEDVAGMEADSALVGEPVLAGSARSPAPETPQAGDPAFGDQRHRAVLEDLEVALDASPPEE